jgi:replicative DNA helicase
MLTSGTPSSNGSSGHGPRTLADLLRAVDLPTSGNGHRSLSYPTGFSPLDTVLDGGLRSHELALVAGKPGVGKTVALMQWARNMAIEGKTAIFVCYEHNEWELLVRLICCELGTIAHPENAPTLDKLRRVTKEIVSGERSLADVLDTEPLLNAAYERIKGYSDRLWFFRGSSARTDLDALAKLAQTQSSEGAILFVDYLQKVASSQAGRDEGDKTLRIAEGLKDLALNSNVGVVATVAVDRAGLAARRLGLHHLRGSSALSYEADVILTMNEKWECVSKLHFAYDPGRVMGFRSQVIVTVDKNRGGPAFVDLEFTKDFASYRFEPRGGYVTERLIDDRVYIE